jgi:hypothetical protein
MVAASASWAAAVSAAPEAKIELDWLLQDSPATHGQFAPAALDAPLRELGAAGADLRKQADELGKQNVPAGDDRYRQLYVRACRMRRAARLNTHFDTLRQFVFIKRTNVMGGSHYAYTEAQSDHQAECHFEPDTALCLLEMTAPAGVATVRPLLADRTGMIRDPDVSYDAKRILFAWKKSLDKDDFHLYEMALPDGTPRQITDGLGFTDDEGAYLPNGDIVFNSTRCVQSVDCAFNEVTNLYTCNPQGRFLRRLSYDQVHTTLPTVTPDGHVIYTRWDYNDRGQIFPQGLFQMNQDGTAQRAFYGNNSWFPTTILHARGIPGSRKVVCVFSGHHTLQKGWLGILDPAMGREENQGAQLIAPVRPTAAEHTDGYGQSGDQFQYPYPLSETEFLVTMLPWIDPTPDPRVRDWERKSAFGRCGLYWIAADGRRELLAYDEAYNCSQCVPVHSRPVPSVPPSTVDYRKTTGTLLLQDIYQGPGLTGVPRGTIKSLRVVALEFRAAAIGSSYNSGPAGGATVSTPISMQGAWDVKVVLGSAKVYPDGSAAFIVPAHTPFYFQALDEKGYAVQTMRSWATLQPGEQMSCVGCHENKNASPPPQTAVPAAYAQGPQKLTPWQGPPRGFSFAREIQPILDEHCIRCHYLPEPNKKDPLGFDRAYDTDGEGNPTWKYSENADAATWSKPAFDDSAWPSGSGVFSHPDNYWNYNGLWKGKKIYLRRTFKLANNIPVTSMAVKIECGGQGEVYINGVHALHIDSQLSGPFFMAQISPESIATLKPGTNMIAVVLESSSHQRGDRFQLRMQDICYRPYQVKDDPAAKPAFSMRGDVREWKWTDGYIAMRNPAYTNWINPQSEPSMLPPYHAGACKSPILTMLQNGHNGVRLTSEELDRIATWIDLLVPCYGDYADSLRGDERKRYDHFLQKRLAEEDRERRNVQEMIENIK